MNWFIKPYKVKVDARYLSDVEDICMHVKIGEVAWVVGEQDSFGPVTRIMKCDACYQELREAEQQELITCHDCGTEHAKGTMQR